MDFPNRSVSNENGYFYHVVYLLMCTVYVVLPCWREYIWIERDIVWEGESCENSQKSWIYIFTMLFVFGYLVAYETISFAENLTYKLWPFGRMIVVCFLLLAYKRVPYTGPRVHWISIFLFILIAHCANNYIHSNQYKIESFVRLIWPSNGSIAAQ